MSRRRDLLTRPAASATNRPNYEVMGATRGPHHLETPAAPHVAPGLAAQLQRAYGNRDVQRAVRGSLRVGPAGDHHEQEADRVAARVAKAPDHGAQLHGPGTEGGVVDARTQQGIERARGRGRALPQARLTDPGVPELLLVVATFNESDARYLLDEDESPKLRAMVPRHLAGAAKATLNARLNALAPQLMFGILATSN